MSSPTPLGSRSRCGLLHKKFRPRLAIWRGVLILCLITSGYADQVGTLLRPTAVVLGKHDVTLRAGLSVRILHFQGITDVVSLTLPDNTALITDLPSDAISNDAITQKPFLKQEAILGADGSNASPQQSPVQPPSRSNDSRPDAVLDNRINETMQYPLFTTLPQAGEQDLPPIRFSVKIETFEIQINKALITVVCALPMEGNHLSRTASNAVFYGPYPNEKTQLKGKIISDLVSRLGCSVFSFQFDGLGQAVSEMPYWSGKGGWFDAVVTARDQIVKLHDLEPRKLILFGYSGGAGMVMSLAAAFPDEVEAVAAQAPNVVPAQFNEETDIKWLLVVNRGDSNRLAMKPFYDRVHSEKGTALYCETTPDRNRGHYHAPSDQALDLIYCFIAGIIGQRELHEKGIDDLPHQWPYAVPASPLDRYAIVKSSDLSVSDLDEGRFDLLPSAAFSAKWSRICPPEQNVIVPESHTKLLINFPARPRPAGIVLYFDTPSYGDVPREVEDTNSLAEHGYLVVSTLTASPSDFVVGAAAWIKSQNKLHGLHIHLIGNGSAGAQFVSSIAQRNDINFKSICLLDFNNGSYEPQWISGVTFAAKECGMYGFYSYADSNQSTHLYDFMSGLADQGARDRGCFNFCAEPKDAPKMPDSTRHAQAECQALTMVETLIGRADSL